MPGADQVDDRALGAGHELELAVEGRAGSMRMSSSSDSTLSQGFSKVHTRKKDLGHFHALTFSTAQKALAALGTAFVTAPGWICETAGHIRLYCGCARHTLFGP